MIALLCSILLNQSPLFFALLRLRRFYHVDLLLACRELAHRLLDGCDWALHPWVAEYIGHGQSLAWLVLEHGREKVDEVGCEEVCGSLFSMALPEYFNFLLGD